MLYYKSNESPIYIVIATKGQLEETEKICRFKFQLRHKMRPHHLHHRSMDCATAGAENLKANSRHDTTVEPTKTWNSPTVVTKKCQKGNHGCLWMFMVHPSNIFESRSHGRRVQNLHELIHENHTLASGSGSTPQCSSSWSGSGSIGILT